MLDLKYIEAHADFVKKCAAEKNDKADIDRILELNTTRKKLALERDTLVAAQRTKGQEMGKLKEPAAKAALKTELDGIKAQVKDLETRQAANDAVLNDLLAYVPNICHESVPQGTSDAANVTVKTGGPERQYDFKLKTIHELSESLGIIDGTRGANVAGSGFYYLRGAGARLERAMLNFFLDTHRKHGFEEYLTPYLVTEKTLYNSTNLPKFKDQLYRVPDDGLMLIPTAEVPLTSLHAGEILEAATLPRRYAAFTACFRREAGAAGIETRGILRVHQFNKVEMYAFTTPEQSYPMLEELRGHAERLLELLGLRYRAVEHCRGDLTFPAAKSYDLEVWTPGLARHLEVSSISNCEAFQARRADIRYRPAPTDADPKPKPQFVHTLNGSGLACPRILISILETYQNPDGTVTIPEVLRPYMQGDEKIVPAK
ncbi:MAG TPA: serine--tRNA ligase [Planctomycetota bacterium]|nr:serine--tRNA ligase [Planctomycetota bacterium]